MPWTRLDEDFGWHPKVQAAGPIAEALHVNALGYCNKYLTDGVIPVDVLPTLLNLSKVLEQIGTPKRRLAVSAQTFADVLVSVGLWERAVGGEYHIHDYLSYQPSRTDVLAERQRRSAAGRAGAAGRWQSVKQHASDSHGKSHARRMPTALEAPMANGCPVPDPVPKRGSSEPLAGNGSGSGARTRTSLDRDHAVIWAKQHDMERLCPRGVEAEVDKFLSQQRGHDWKQPSGLMWADENQAWRKWCQDMLDKDARASKNGTKSPAFRDYAAEERAASAGAAS